MKKILLLMLGLLIITNVCVAATSSNFKMVKHLTVDNDSVYNGSIMSIGGSVIIAPQGKFQGSVILFGGKLQLNGTVEEDVICLAADVQLGENARIIGDFFVIGGQLSPADKLAIKKRVDGEYMNFKFNLKKIESTLLPIFSDSQTLAFFKVVKIVFWLIITLIVFAVVPRKINLAEEIFENHLLKIATTGIISLFTFVFLLFLCVILSFVIIGIPLLFVLVIAYFITYIFGRTVMFYFIGIKLAHRLKLKNITPALFIVIGVILYAALKFLPFVGPTVLIILNVCEVGIGIGFFFRKKLKLES
jgi:cytoskeletal protein CcmA (bactofilin family)